MRGHRYAVTSVSWSPDGTKIASGSNDDMVRIWEVATDKELSTLKKQERKAAVCIERMPSLK